MSALIEQADSTHSAVMAKRTWYVMRLKPVNAMPMICTQQQLSDQGDSAHSLVHGVDRPRDEKTHGPQNGHDHSQDPSAR